MPLSYLHLSTLILNIYLGSCRLVEVRLIDGSAENEGTILVKDPRNAARWGIVCDDGWNKRAGHVVCKQLGYNRAKKVTRYNTFKTTKTYDILLDDVFCYGREQHIGRCRHSSWYRSDCTQREAAGVVCEESIKPTTRPTTRMEISTPSSRVTTTSRSQKMKDQPLKKRPQATEGPQATERRNKPSKVGSNRNGITNVKRIYLSGGRNKKEGYVKVELTDGSSGTICSDGWGLREATVVCRELGLQYADRGTQSDFFRGARDTKLIHDVNCTGTEGSLKNCHMISVSDSSSKCTQSNRVAGVICTSVLPDLLPNITTLEQSISIQDRYMGHLSCSMEENCLASSAYKLKEARPRTWQHLSRRLLRFSSSIYNAGTADFRPRQHKNSWEWHSCHMHYHSMETFSRYDVIDSDGHKVAEGHKASFCLEDVECDAGKRKRYSCRGYGDQGISVGCSDIYKHDIDCQWIDVTDVKAGTYIFKLNINPEFLIPELNFDNNAAICDLKYTGYSAKLMNCRLGRG